LAEVVETELLRRWRHDRSKNPLMSGDRRASARLNHLEARAVEPPRDPPPDRQA
jgi:hypothetical protein